jgi:hypothetical protein
MKRLLLVLTLMALPLAAQDQKKEEPKEPQFQKLFVLKYADPNQINNLIRVFTGNTNPNPEMHAIAVSATATAMAAIEDAIKRLDVPAAGPQNVELMAYLLVGSAAAAAPPADLPKDLDSVLTQIKAAFSYKGYKLEDVLALRGRTGQQLSTSGSGWSVPIGNGVQPVMTQFSVGSLNVGADGEIHINRLRLDNRVPQVTGGQGSTQFTMVDLNLNTDLDIKEGQKVVVGKLGLNQDEALFLVLMAHVAQ